jgi:hypothetical protein
MQDELINKRAVLEMAYDMSEIDGEHFTEPHMVVDVEDIQKLPPVAPQQKTGRWVEEIISVGTRKIFCSECGCSVPFEHVSNGDVYSASGYGVITKTKFCPSCGTRMLEPQESEEV